MSESAASSASAIDTQLLSPKATASMSDTEPDMDADALSISMSEASEEETASGEAPVAPEVDPAVQRSMERLANIGGRVEGVEERTTRMPAVISSKAAHVIAEYWRRVAALHTGAAEEQARDALGRLPVGASAEDKDKAARSAWAMPKPVMLSTSAMAYNCAGDAEALMKALMDLDAVESNGDEGVRAARKALVKRVHATLDTADRITARAKRVVELSETLAKRLEAEARRAGVTSLVPEAEAEAEAEDSELETAAPVAPEATARAAVAVPADGAQDGEEEDEEDEEKDEVDEEEEDEEEDEEEEEEEEEEDEEEEEAHADASAAPVPTRRVYYDAFGRPIVVATGEPRARTAPLAPQRRKEQAAKAGAAAAQRVLRQQQQQQQQLEQQRQRQRAHAEAVAQARAQAEAEARARARARARVEAAEQERARQVALRRLRAAQERAAAQRAAENGSCRGAYSARHLAPTSPQHQFYGDGVAYDDDDDGGYDEGYGYGYAAPRATARPRYVRAPASPFMGGSGYARRNAGHGYGGRGFGPSLFDMVW